MSKAASSKTAACIRRLAQVVNDPEASDADAIPRGVHPARPRGGRPGTAHLVEVATTEPDDHDDPGFIRGMEAFLEAFATPVKQHY